MAKRGGGSRCRYAVVHARSHTPSSNFLRPANAICKGNVVVGSAGEAAENQTPSAPKGGCPISTTKPATFNHRQTLRAGLFTMIHC